jgi:hypothetical protein
MFCLAVGLCVAFAPRAEAQCGLSLQHGNGVRAAFNNASPIAPNAVNAQKPEADDGKGEATIVGLWDVQFISDGMVVDEGFDQYHSDGLEILNDTPPPATGNVCLGVYEKTGPRSIKLRHPSWIYDPATNTTVIGRATILENIKVDKGGRTFTGTFTVQLRDPDGNILAPDITGELQGTRITPE